MRIVSYGMPMPQNAWTGRVHSVFEHSLNIATENHGLITVHGDFHIVLPASVSVENLITAHIHQGDAAIFDGKALLVGQTMMEERKPCPYISTKLESQKVLVDFEQMRTVYRQKRKEQEQTLNMDIIRYVEKLAVELEANINESEEVVKACVKKLIGCGLGLTPSGDDILVGMLAYYGMAIPTLYEKLKKPVESMVQNTTAVSEKYLTCACHGFFSSQIQELLLAKGVEETLKQCRSMVEFGHSSGTDSLYGILVASKQEKSGNQWGCSDGFVDLYI